MEISKADLVWDTGSQAGPNADGWYNLLETLSENTRKSCVRKVSEVYCLKPQRPKVKQFHFSAVDLRNWEETDFCFRFFVFLFFAYDCQKRNLGIQIFQQQITIVLITRTLPFIFFFVWWQDDIFLVDMSVWKNISFLNYKMSQESKHP